ncbi:MAG: hypothetical protein ACLFT5_03975 [Desulfovermiculus sp.]
MEVRGHKQLNKRLLPKNFQPVSIQQVDENLEAEANVFPMHYALEIRWRIDLGITAPHNLTLNR